MINFTVPGDRRLCYCSTYDSERTMGMGMGFIENSELKMPRGRWVIVNASWMDRVSVAYMYLPGTVFEIWQCGCKDPNNLNDQIQGPCNDAAAGPNGSASLLESRLLLEEPGLKAVGCRTRNRRMRMHEQYHLGFRNAVEKKHTTVLDWTIQNEKATVARLLEGLFATTWPYIVFLDSTTFESMLLDTLGESQSTSRGRVPTTLTFIDSQAEFIQPLGLLTIRGPEHLVGGLMFRCHILHDVSLVVCKR